MDYNHTYFKFMHDIIDSGAWGKLSSTAKTLYPILCRFTNESFKEVWPGTDELLRLTGFKTKKSLQQAKKELMDAGLIDYVSGNGRKSSRYYFKFSYPNSRVDISTYRDSIVSARGLNSSPSAEYKHSSERGILLPPNNININIQTNNEKQETSLQNIENLLNTFLNLSNKSDNSENFKTAIINKMLTKYGDLEVGEAIKIAIQRGKNGDISYLEGILRNRKDPIKNKQGSSNKHTNSYLNILNQLKPKYAEIDRILKFYYYYNDIYYFKSISECNNKEIENFAQSCGFQIKIISSYEIVNNAVEFNIKQGI